MCKSFHIDLNSNLDSSLAYLSHAMINTECNKRDEEEEHQSFTGTADDSVVL
jgi:hypothetical protein